MRIIPRRFAPRRLDFGEEAPLVDHLGELRHRVVFALISLVVTFSVTYAFRHDVIGWLERPLPVGKRDLVTLSPMEPFITSLMVSLYAAFLLSFPVIVYQVWAFFAPALNPKIQRGVVAMTAFATMLGGLGLAFGYFVALPAAVKFLTSYDDALYDIQIRARVQEAEEEPAARLRDHGRDRGRAARHRPDHDDARDDPAADPLRELDLDRLLDGAPPQEEGRGRR